MATHKPEGLVLFDTLEEQDAEQRYVAKAGDVFMFQGIRLTAVERKGCKDCAFAAKNCFMNVMCQESANKSVIFADDETLVDIVTERLMGKEKKK